MKLLFLVCAAVAILHSIASGHQTHAEPLCFVQADTAEIHRKYIELQVTVGDSTQLANLGIPYRPTEGVTFVSDSTICHQAIEAYNALFPPADSAKHVSGAYVFRVGSNTFVVALEDFVYAFLNSDYQLLGMFAGLR